jgi:predicted nucleic acid-binding protein
MRTLAHDASVAINLLGTGQAADILRLVNRKYVIEDSARGEVQRDAYNGQAGSASLDALRQSGLLTYSRLGDTALASFLALTGAEPPDDLDDGEAATIALAVDIGAVAMLDDKKAIRVAQQRHSSLVVLQTLDFLSCGALVAAVSSAELADIVYAALQNARMRVPLLFQKWTVEVIGYERATKCPSLGSV